MGREEFTMPSEGFTMADEGFTMADERLTTVDKGFTKRSESFTMGEVIDTMAQVIDTMADERFTMRRGEITMANLRGKNGFLRRRSGNGYGYEKCLNLDSFDYRIALIARHRSDADQNRVSKTVNEVPKPVRHPDILQVACLPQAGDLNWGHIA